MAISDPGIRRSQDVRLGWYLGNRVLGSLRKVATPLLQHAVESLRTSKTVLWGSSGGGYAAVNFGQDFPDSLVFAINPRLNISARPAAPIAKFMNVNFEPKGPTPYNRMLNTYVPQNLAEQYTEGLPFDLGIFQNYGDRLYREHQYEPFADALDGDTRLWSRLDNIGEGHLHIPSEALAEIMEIFSDDSLSNEQSLEQAGFCRPQPRDAI